MPAFIIWAVIIALVLAIGHQIWTAHAEVRAERARTEAHKRAKQAALQAKYDSLPLGHVKDNHQLVAAGQLDSGFYYYLVRTCDGDNRCYLLVIFYPDGRVQDAKSLFVSALAEQHLLLNIGWRKGGARATFPEVPPPTPYEPAWVDLRIPGYYSKFAPDVLFDLASEQAKEWRRVTDKQKLERAEREERRRREQAECRRQEYRDLENWSRDPNRLKGLFMRWSAAPPEHREIIRDQLRALISAHDEEIDRVDFDALPDEGRRLCLSLYLGIKVGGTYPTYDFGRSNPAAERHVYVCAHGPADAKPWRERAVQISRYLGGRWAVTELDGTHVELSRMPDLPAVIPFDQRYLRKGHLFCGINAASAVPVHIPLAKMTHMLVCGQTGSGKSVGLNQIQRSMLYNIDDIAEIAACDLKGGVDLAQFAGLSPKIQVIDSYAAMHDLAERWVAAMKARFAEMRANGESNTTGNYRNLIVDEFSEIGGYEPTKDEKPRHAKLLNNLSLLAQQGRAAGIRLILQTQAPTADYLPTGIVKNLPSVMCYRMSSRQNIAALFAGHGDDLPADPTTFKSGEYLFANGATGELIHLRTTACHEHDVGALRACLPVTV